MVSIVLVLALLILIVWGTYIGRRIRLAEYSSNRSHGKTKDIFFTLMGSLVGGYMFFGLTAIGYEAGTVAIAVGIGYCIGLLLLAISVPKIKAVMNEYDCDTMDDFIGAKFGKKVQTLVSITNFIFFIAVVAAQFIGMTSYLRVVSPNMATWLPLVAALVVILYTSLAGYKGVVLTDFPQFIVLSIGALSLLIILILNTNWETVNTISKSHFPPTGYGIVFLFGSILLFPLTLYSRSDLWQRVAYSNSPKNARKAFLLTIPFLLLFYIVFTVIGIISRAELGAGLPPESSGLDFFTKILSTSTGFSLFPELLLAIVSLGIFAALLSTADTNLNIGSLALTKLIFMKKWKLYSDRSDTESRFKGPLSEEEKSLIRNVRVVSGLLGSLALLLAIIIPDIVDLMVACASILMIFLPSVIGALFKGHSNSMASFMSVLLGLFSFVVFSFVLHNYKIAFVPSGIFAFLIYVAFIKINRKKG